MTKYSKEFQYVWRRWPKRKSTDQFGEVRWIKRKKKEAWAKWQLLDEYTQKLIVANIQRAKNTEGSSARDLVTWINNEGWEDWDLPDDYIPVLPKDFTGQVGHSDALKKIDFNLERTNQLRKLNAS